MTGTTPAGTHSEQEASRWVRDMFCRVACRYDLANHLLSWNIDRSWRSRTVRSVQSVLERPGARVFDLCCGTGDLLFALEDAGRARVFGGDFCHPMLTAAAHKRHGARLMEADALALPLADGSLDLITIAFGFRNLANYEAGLAEFRRVLAPGGMLAILEFSHPTSRPFAALYEFYSRRVLPWIGGAITGSRDAYAYLPESVAKFPGAEDLGRMMERAGFGGVRFERMTGGAVALHLGER